MKLEREAIQMDGKMRFRSQSGDERGQIIARPQYGSFIFTMNILKLAGLYCIFTHTHPDHLLKPLWRSRIWLSPFPRAEDLSCAVSQLVLDVPVTALDGSSGSALPANW